MGIMDVWIDRSIVNNNRPILLDELPEVLQLKPVKPAASITGSEIAIE
jgi:hypothetical protein